MNVLRYLPRFRKAYQAIEALNQVQSWTTDQIQAHQLAQVNQLWRRAVRESTYYRDLQNQLGLDRDFKSLAEYQHSIPILEKHQVRDHPEQFISSQRQNGRWQRTGGSTGNPTSVFWSNQAHRDNLRLRYAWLSRFDVDIFDPQAFLWGHAGSFAPGLKGKISRFRQPIEDRLRNRLRFSAYAMADSNLDRYLEVMARAKTRWVYGYSSAIFLLANRALETQILPESLKLLVMTGEPAIAEYGRRVKEAFGAPGQIEYGSVECGLLALENLEGRLQIQENQRLVETIPRDDGQYDLVVTVLDNPSFPLMRFRIGDTTSQPLSRPHDGLAVLSDVMGRNNDFLINKDGGYVHANAVKHALEHIPRVKRFQAVQDRDGNLDVLIENQEGTPSIEDAEIVERLETLLQGYPVSLRRVDMIQGNLAGKHTWVKSELFEADKQEKL